MKIITSPDPLLRQVCEPVEIGDKTIKKLAKDMLREMYRDQGVGLAAPQIGVLKRIVVIDVNWIEEDAYGRPAKKKPLIFINPEIIEHSEERVVNAEGCLSVPGISCDIERWSWVKVKCYDENFKEVIREGDGLFGRCMQHELDHLDGITLFERINPIERIGKLEEYKFALENGAQPGEC